MRNFRGANVRLFRDLFHRGHSQPRSFATEVIRNDAGIPGSLAGAQRLPDAFDNVVRAAEIGRGLLIVVDAIDDRDRR